MPAVRVFALAGLSGVLMAYEKMTDKTISKMTAKERHRLKMLDFWGDPANDFVNRELIAAELRISKQTLYKHFTPKEISEVEAEAYELRKKCSARQRGEVLYSLYSEGKKGNVPAAKEFLDRTEGKVTEKHEHTGKDGGPIRHIHDQQSAIEEMKKRGLPIPEID